MNLIAQIQRALAERLPDFVIAKIEPTLRVHPLDGFPERICEIDLLRFLRERSPIFSEAEITRAFPTESRQQIALTLLGPGSVMAHLPIGALGAACGDDRLKTLVDNCRRASVYEDTSLSPEEGINLMILYMFVTGQLRVVP